MGSMAMRVLGGSTWGEETGFKLPAEKYASGRCFYKRLAPNLYLEARLYFHTR
jgi:hypothetical protein